VVYEVEAVTGDDKGAGTTARVYLEAWGAGEGEGGCGTGEVRLLDADSPHAPFERGATDRFEVLCRDVGFPAVVRVWHDSTGRHPDWLLVRLSMRKKVTEEWTHFPCCRLGAEVGLRGVVGGVAVGWMSWVCADQLSAVPVPRLPCKLSATTSASTNAKPTPGGCLLSKMMGAPAANSMLPPVHSTHQHH